MWGRQRKCKMVEAKWETSGTPRLQTAPASASTFLHPTKHWTLCPRCKGCWWFLVCRWDWGYQQHCSGNRGTLQAASCCPLPWQNLLFWPTDRTRRPFWHHDWCAPALQCSWRFFNQPSTTQKRHCLTEYHRAKSVQLSQQLSWMALITSSHICFLYSSYVQQLAPTTTITDLIGQINHLRALKKESTKFHTLSDNCHSAQRINFSVFCCCAKCGSRPTFCFDRSPTRKLSKRICVSHALWMRYMSKRPVQSAGGAKILAAGEAIDQRKMLRFALSALFPLKIDFMFIVVSHGLFNSLSTSWNSTNCSNRTDIDVIVASLSRATLLT